MLDRIDRLILAQTQAGLPLAPEPYEDIANAIGISASEVMDRLSRLLARGSIRRIGVIPNHVGLGVRGNGMTVWDVEDERVSELGRRVGALDFVTHCYRRPRHGPDWPYNLFAMVHGPDRDAVEAKARLIGDVLGDACRAHDVLHSIRLLKKTGLRVVSRGPLEASCSV